MTLSTGWYQAQEQRARRSKWKQGAYGCRSGSSPVYSKRKRHWTLRHARLSSSQDLTCDRTLPISEKMLFKFSDYFEIRTRYPFSYFSFVLHPFLSFAYRTVKAENQWTREIYVSERIQDRKSIFQARATEMTDPLELPVFLNYLSSLPVLKRATHCMYAYRILSSPELKDLEKSSQKWVCGQHDGGESGSGDRLSRLLELSNCQNVIVVVSRWYGGTKLGADRWRRISEVAKEALSKGESIRREERTVFSRKRRK